MFICILLLFNVGAVGIDENMEEEVIIDQTNITSVSEAIYERNTVLRSLLVQMGYSDIQISKRLLNSEDVIDTFYFRYGMIVTGKIDSNKKPMISDPEIKVSQDVDDDGDYRILGKSVAGEWVENPFFDSTPLDEIDKRDWIASDDYTRISKSVIGPLINEDSLFTTTDLIKRYYVNFLVGFKEDYALYLSQDFFDEFDDANVDFQNRYLAGEFGLNDIDKGYDSFWQVGSGGGSITGTDMGQYIRIVSIPTEHSNGLAYLFHERGNKVYYLSVPLLSDAYVKNQLSPNIAVGGEIIVPPLVQDEIIVDGELTFDITASDHISHYEIVNISQGLEILGSQSASINGGLKSFKGAIPIHVAIEGSSKTVSLTINAYDVNGNMASTTLEATISRVGDEPRTTDKMDPNVSALLRADKRGQEIYDVGQGIPSSETLYAQVRAREYLLNEVYEKVEASRSYRVSVKKEYELIWTEIVNGVSEIKSKKEVKTKTYTINKNYSYHKVINFDVYKLSDAVLSSDVLPHESIALIAKGIEEKNVDVIVYNDNLKDTSSGLTITHWLPTEQIDGGLSGQPDLPESNWYTHAEHATGTLSARNDRVIFDGLTVLDDAWQVLHANNISPIDTSTLCHEDALYEPSIKIPQTRLNGTYETSGQVSYENVYTLASSTVSNIDMPISSINSVALHTPVVCYPNLFDASDHLQVENHDDLPSLVIDQEFKLDIPSFGQHLDIKGFGQSDYAAYVRSKQIKFDFDVYLQSDSGQDLFIPNGQWYSLSPSSENVVLTIPHWVEEGSGNVYTRVFAINTPASYSGLYDYNYNRDLDDYFAVDHIAVDISGQIYDLRILSTTDKVFNKLFFDDGKRINDLFVGPYDHHGLSQVHRDNFLPLMPGSGSQIMYEGAQALGHPFFFSVKVSGNMDGKDDFVVVRPSFYYVDKRGQNRKQVDLWYEVNGKLLSLKDNPKTLNMALDTSYTDIDKGVLSDTLRVELDLYDDTSHFSNDDYKNYYLYDLIRETQKIGATDFLALDYRQRVFAGDIKSLPSDVDEIKALSGQSIFYGMYLVPASSIAVPRGTNVSEVVKETLLNGYIIVNFDIKTINGFTGDPDDTHLSYNGGSHMYEREGFINYRDDFSLIKGDVIFFDTNRRADEDFFTVGTH